jgi:hypothetical protein
VDSRSKVRSATLNHAPDVDPVRRLFGERAGATRGRAEEGGLVVAADFRRLDVGELTLPKIASTHARLYSDCYS